jgi:hypothetical protein
MSHSKIRALVLGTGERYEDDERAQTSQCETQQIILHGRFEVRITLMMDKHVCCNPDAFVPTR